MLNQESDAQLWLQAVSGTEHAFAIIFDRHRSRVFRAAHRRTNNVADSEDIVAMVFLEAWRLRKKVRIVDGSLLPWLISVTTNVTLNATRSERRYRRMLSSLPAPQSEPDHAPRVEQEIDSRERATALVNALTTLAPRDRIVVHMCWIEELPLATAAAALDLPVGTVKSRLHRARRVLRDELGVPEVMMAVSETQTQPREIVQ